MEYGKNIKRLLTVLTTVLVAFYNLRGLDLSPTNAVVRHTASDGQQQNDAVEEQHLCITWLGACPSLRRVVFPSQTEWSLSEDGTWISGSGPRSPDSLPRSYLGASYLYACLPVVVINVASSDAYPSSLIRYMTPQDISHKSRSPWPDQCLLERLHDTAIPTPAAVCQYSGEGIQRPK